MRHLWMYVQGRRDSRAQRKKVDEEGKGSRRGRAMKRKGRVVRIGRGKSRMRGVIGGNSHWFCGDMLYHLVR